MNQEQFAAIMPYISADLVEMIAKKKSISENDAITKLYNSELYAILSRRIQKFGNTVPICCIRFWNRKKRRGKSNFPMCKDRLYS